MSESQQVFLDVLSTSMGRKEVDWLSYEAILSEDNFNLFFSLIFGEDKKIAWHACWVIEKVSEQAPELFKREHNQQLVDFTLINRHDGLQRLCLSILLNLPILQPISVEFINRCFEQMVSPKEPVAAQVLSMKMLGRICELEPEFTPELIYSLENTDDSLYSKGYLAAKNNLLKRLRIRM